MHGRRSDILGKRLHKHRVGCVDDGGAVMEDPESTTRLEEEGRHWNHVLFGDIVSFSLILVLY